MAELFGKKTGICRGQGGSMHMFSKKHGLVSSDIGDVALPVTTNDESQTCPRGQLCGRHG